VRPGRAGHVGCVLVAPAVADVLPTPGVGRDSLTVGAHTIFGALGMPPPRQTDGAVLTPVLESGSPATVEVFGEPARGRLVHAPIAASSRRALVDGSCSK
jgi:hypothetical protein